MRVLRITTTLAALALIAGASTAEASVPLGQIAETPTGDCGTNFDFLQKGVQEGNSYTVPDTGGISSWNLISWSTNAGVGASSGAEYTLKVFRQVAGSNYVVGHDGPRPLVQDGLSLFASNLAVKPGDLLGIHTSTTGTNCIASTGLSEDALLFRSMSDLADGSSGTFGPGSGSRLNIAAELTPTNAFALGAVQRNKKKGTATLTVSVPNPGTLAVSGRGVKAPGVSPGSQAVPGPGDVQLAIGAKGKKRRKLKETGKVKLQLSVAYTPTGGDAGVQSTELKLKKR
jgi:hypothetical protein